VADGSSLCVACGLCCNGALFAHAKAVDAELRLLAEAGLETFERNGRHRFRLPCRHHCDGSGCGIYAQRFEICRSFSCSLLSKVETGEIPLDEAAATVRQARTMLAGLGDPSALERKAERQQVSGYAAVEDEGERGAKARRYLELVALEMFLDKHFRNKPVLAMDDGSAG
jgi:uncharacterized protein